MLRLAGSYLDHDAQSYRQTVRWGGTRIGYVANASSHSGSAAPAAAAAAAASASPSASRGVIDERVLCPMTIWRMLTWMGCQLVALAEARRQVLESNPQSTCHWFVGAVAPQKFRSPQRQRQLQQACQLLHVAAEWEELFREKFFPRFATRAGFS